MEQNKSSKLNTVLLVVLIILVIFGLYMMSNKKESQPLNEMPTGQTQVNTNPNGNDYQPNQNPACDSMGCLPGMQDGGEKGLTTITKSDWGISFVKPAGWMGSSTSVEVVLNQVSGQWAGDTMTIQYVSGPKITDTDSKFGEITYFYDESSHQWMETDNMEGENIFPHSTPTPAKTQVYTSDNLPVFSGTARWKTYIIPLSHTTFLKLNITGSGYTMPLDDLIKTIKKV